MTFSRAVQVSVTVAGGTIPTNTVSSFVYDGETYTLDAAHPVGFFEDGSPFIVSASAGQITNTSTPSQTLNGAVAHGMMKNPFWTWEEGQGLDGFLADYPPAPLYNMPYSAALNVDPGASNTATWTAGEKASFVKSFRHPSKTTNSAQFQTVAKYHVITVLDAAPPVGSVRPGMAGTTKVVRQVPASFTPRGYTLPASWPDVATIMSKVPPHLGLLSTSLIKLRILRLDPSYNDANDGYSAKLTDDYARYVYALNSSNATQQQRDDMIRQIMVNAADLEAILDLGHSFGDAVDGGAGQGGGLFLWVMAAAALTQDAALMAKIRGKTQVDYDQFWIDNSLVGIAAPVASTSCSQTYFAEQVGMPWTEADEITSNQGRYTAIGGNIAAWETVAVLGFNQGPPGYANGAQMMLNGGAENSTSNPYAATLACCARIRTWEPWPTWSYGLTQSWKDAWDQMVATGDFTPWTGKPEQPPTWGGGTFDDGAFFSAGAAGEIVLDTVGINYATETVTSRDFRYSLDGQQWVVESNIALTGNNYTKGGLLRGAVHWCGWRMNSASGAGMWSMNYPLWNSFTSGNDTNRVTTTGTDTATAPSYTGGVQPAIMRRTYPNWGYPYYEPAPASVAVGDLLSCGVGYVAQAYPAPTYSYQWKRNGANISGATSKTYTVQGADSGAALTCEITASNASGSDTATTAGVTVV